MDISEIKFIFTHPVYYSLFTLLNLTLIIIAIYRILTSKRDPVGAVVWIFIVVFLPGIGLLLYFVFGWTRFKTKIKKYIAAARHIQQLKITHLKEKDKESNNKIIEIYKKTVKSNNLFDSLEQHPPAFGNSIKMLISGNEAYPSMLESINTAKKNICMQSYLFNGDNIGNEFADALIEKKKQGVDIRIIYDPIGSIKTSGAFWRYLKRNGVQVFSFGSLNILKQKCRLNFRNHRKNLIIDGKTVFCGGLNIANENYSKYCSDKNRFIHDYHFKIEGPATGYFQMVFAQDWFYLTGENLEGADFFPLSNETAGDNIIRVIDSNATNNYKVYSFALLGAIMHAEKKIKIITPYFYPEPEILSALKYAALSGLDVSIILPQKNEHRIIGYAARSLYKELIECNIKIYERKLPFIHSKSMIIDDEWAILGSGNFDYISMRLNYELCFEVIGAEIITDLNRWFDYEKNQSEKIEISRVLNYNKFEILRDNFCALFAPVL